MLSFLKRRSRRPRLELHLADESIVDSNPDLRIRDLRDDPLIRRALGLADEHVEVSTAA